MESIVSPASPWVNLLGLFERVTELPANQRRAFIDSQNLDESTLNRLNRMLETLDHTVALLETPLLNNISYKKNWFKNNWEQKTLGAFTLDTLIHEGNNAAVFLASQTEPVERQVIIKLMRPDADEALINFFRFEQQTLAKLNHPNIASIFTVNETEDGVPYIVMEYIDGEELLDYCDSQKLSIKERLELLIQICDAISYSHQNGVLHRDLKSSNLLIRNFNGKPTPTIIDFGIASQLNEHLVQPEEVLIGTPEYMSPEHVFDINNMDERADVYSLGMILFTMLVGRIPFQRQKIMALNTAERMSYIAEFQPPVPSKYLKSMSTEQQLTLADERDISSKLLRKAIDFELDSIFTKATHKDRDQRYATVQNFVDDLKNYLSDHSVTALVNNPFYRFKKFAKRNRYLIYCFLSSVLVLCVLVFSKLNYEPENFPDSDAIYDDYPKLSKSQDRRATELFNDLKKKYKSAFDLLYKTENRSKIDKLEILYKHHLIQKKDNPWSNEAEEFLKNFYKKNMLEALQINCLTSSCQVLGFINKPDYAPALDANKPTSYAFLTEITLKLITDSDYNKYFKVDKTFNVHISTKQNNKGQYVYIIFFNRN